MPETADKAGRVLDELAAKVKPSDLDKLDDSFHDRLRRLEQESKLDAETISRLEVMWAMLKTPDDVVPWTSKALIMAAIGYFAAPLDLIPDFAGRAGYADDELVIRLAYDRLGALTSKFG